MTEESRTRSSLIKNFEELSAGKEKAIKEMGERLEARERDFREERTRWLGDLERERKKN
jgi:hypothetical protein